jgi:acetolactate synthase-1/2/3 large subunit
MLHHPVTFTKNLNRNSCPRKAGNAVQTQKATSSLEAKYGSDLIVDMMKECGVEYIALNPGATFRGIHESIVDYGGNSMPELIEVCHEEVAVAMAHGYSRVKRKPMAAFVHDFVGLLHSTMAIFYAFTDYAPVLVFGATGPMDLTKRRAGIDWIHTALVNGNVVRDYVKWDDQPANIESVPETMVRALRVSMTEPQGPVYVCFDAALQEAELMAKIKPLQVSKFPASTSVSPDPDVLRKVADMLVQAENPVIMADMVGRNTGAVGELVKLAELTSTPVIDLCTRFNFPNTHPLDASLTDIHKDADLLLALDVPELESRTSQTDQITRTVKSSLRDDCKLVRVGLTDLNIRSLVQNYFRLVPSDLAVTADTSIAIPQLAKLCKERITPSMAATIAERFERLRDSHNKIRAKWKEEARKGWNNRPITTARLASEVWKVISSEDWVLTSLHILKTWARKLWDWQRPDCYGGRDLGTATNIGMSLGIALAYRNTDKLVVDVQPDGDMLYDASAIWTGAHHHIPMLIVMYNNRGYWNDWDHQIRVTKNRQRPLDKAHIGVEIDNPPPNFAKLAESMGCFGIGPIEDPDGINEALTIALKAMKQNRTPAVVDVITDPH